MFYKINRTQKESLISEITRHEVMKKCGKLLLNIAN